MPTSDTSEQGFERLIVESLGTQAGYVQGRSEDYDRDHSEQRKDEDKIVGDYGTAVL